MGKVELYMTNMQIPVLLVLLPSHIWMTNIGFLLLVLLTVQIITG